MVFVIDRLREQVLPLSLPGYEPGLIAGSRAIIYDFALLALCLTFIKSLFFITHSLHFIFWHSLHILSPRPSILRLSPSSLCPLLQWVLLALTCANIPLLVFSPIVTHSKCSGLTQQGFLQRWSTTILYGILCL